MRQQAHVTNPALAGFVTLVATMRFFRYSRTYRIWGSIVWGLLFCVWVPTSWTHSARHPWQPWIWMLLTLVQFASLWTWWDITDDELVAHSFGFSNRYSLARIDDVRPPATQRRLLAKTVQIDYRGRRSLYVTVADKFGFEHALRAAVAAHAHDASTTDPLGLSS